MPSLLCQPRQMPNAHKANWSDFMVLPESKKNEKENFLFYFYICIVRKVHATQSRTQRKNTFFSFLGTIYYALHSEFTERERKANKEICHHHNSWFRTDTIETYDNCMFVSLFLNIVVFFSLCFCRQDEKIS